jgi:hypothetical protein
MSITYTCDWCGEGADGDEFVTLSTSRSRRSPHYGNSGWVGHYHEDCFESVREALRTAHDVGQDLRGLSTATTRVGPWEEPLYRDRHWLRDELRLKGLTLGTLCFQIKSTGILTTGDLRAAVCDGSLRRVIGVGPKTFDTIKRGLEAFAEAEGVTVAVAEDLAPANGGQR